MYEKHWKKIVVGSKKKKTERKGSEKKNSVLKQGAFTALTMLPSLFPTIVL